MFMAKKVNETSGKKMEDNEEIHTTEPSTITSNRRKEKFPPFKELKRETIGETYQYVNQLVKGKQSRDFGNIRKLMSSTEQLPLFEQSLKLIIIDNLKMKDEVINVLLCQNNYHIKRILRCNWFFQSLLSPEYYCTKILPHVSISLRYKIINQLSRNLLRETDAEELFNNIFSSYGYQQAKILLSQCSSQFILNFFNKKKLLFVSKRSGTVLLKITQRYPNVGCHILDAICVTSEYDHTLYDFKNVFLYLACKYPQIFIPFFKKHYLKMKFLSFGRKLSQKLGLQLKDFLINIPNLGVFREESLFRVLSCEDKAKYLASYVKSMGETLSLRNWARATNNFVPLLKLLPPNHVLPIVKSAFKEVYNLNFSDCPKAWELKLLEVIPLGERLPYVESLDKFLFKDRIDREIHFSNVGKFLASEIIKEPQKLVCLKECTDAFNSLTAFIQRAPTVNEREKVLLFAVRNCVINKDPEGLEKLLRYVQVYHRNDSHKLIFKVLEEVIVSFPYWAYTLNTVQTLERICYHGAITNDFYHYHLIMEKCILRRMEEGMNVKIQVKNVVNLALVHEAIGRGVIRDIRSKHSRNLFHEYYREIFQWIKENPSNEKTKRHLTNLLLETLSMFNFIHKNHPILLRDLPELLAQFEELLNELHADLSFDFNWINLWEKFSKNVEIVSSSYRFRFFKYTLKRNPEAVIENMEPVWKYLCENYNYSGKELFLDLKKIFSFMGQIDKVKETLLERFQTRDSTTVKVNALKMYARVCNSKEFGKAIQDYFPKKGIPDCENEANFLKVQIAIPHVIKDVKPDCENMFLISEFLGKNFMKNVSPSLMSYCHHTRADLLVANLLMLLDSIRELNCSFYEKTLIRMVVGALNRSKKLSFCERRWKQSRHYSVRMMILKFISELFLEDPTRQVFEILSEYILESDDLIIESRPDISRVPKEFINDYVAVLWKFSDHEWGSFAKNFKNSILRFFTSQNIGWLSENLSENIIKNYLFKRTGIEINNFAIYYLISDPKEVEPRKKMIFNLLKDSTVDEATLSSFLRTLKTIWLEGPFPQIFESFLKDWPDSVILPFDERLSLNYFSLYEKIGRNVSQDKFVDVVSCAFGKELKEFYSSFDDSNDFVLIFVECLKHFFELLEGSTKKLNTVLVAKELLAHPSSRTSAIIAILILPDPVVEFYTDKDPYVTKHSHKEDFTNIINLLEINEDKVVQVYFRRKFGFKKLTRVSSQSSLRTDDFGCVQ